MQRGLYQVYWCVFRIRVQLSRIQFGIQSSPKWLNWINIQSAEVTLDSVLEFVPREAAIFGAEKVEHFYQAIKVSEAKELPLELARFFTHFQVGFGDVFYVRLYAVEYVLVVFAYTFGTLDQFINAWLSS